MVTAEIHNLICVWLNWDGRLQTVVSAVWFCLHARDGISFWQERWEAKEIVSTAGKAGFGWTRLLKS